MIKKEFYGKNEDGINLFRTYSDENYKIRKTGTDEVYEDALDLETSSFEYEETDEKIEIFNPMDFIEESEV